MENRKEELNIIDTNAQASAFESGGVNRLRRHRLFRHAAHRARGVGRRSAAAVAGGNRISVAGAGKYLGDDRDRHRSARCSVLYSASAAT